MTRKHQPLPDRQHPRRLDQPLYRAPEQPVFITFRARSCPPLSDWGTADTIISVMRRIAANCGIRILAYCIMPDHVHVVVSVSSHGGDVEKWLRYTKRAVQEALGARGMWQRSYWDRHARSHEDVATAVAYILQNPVRKGLCDGWEDWPFSWSEWHDRAHGAGTDG